MHCRTAGRWKSVVGRGRTRSDRLALGDCTAAHRHSPLHPLVENLSSVRQESARRSRCSAGVLLLPRPSTALALALARPQPPHAATVDRSRSLPVAKCNRRRSSAAWYGETNASMAESLTRTRPILA